VPVEYHPPERGDVLKVNAIVLRLNSIGWSSSNLEQPKSHNQGGKGPNDNENDPPQTFAENFHGKRVKA
jgi:hypothetical protein